MFLNHLSSYLQETTVHGFRYLAESTSTHLEKLFWLIAVASSFSVAAYMVLISRTEAK